MQRAAAAALPLDALPPSYQSWSAGAPDAFWMDLALAVRAQGTHFVDLVMAKGQDLVRARRYGGSPAVAL